MAFDEDFDVPDESSSQLVNLNDLNLAELLDLRSRIDILLPAKNLKDMNLEEELVNQYHVARALQTQVLSSGEEANKKAQVLNTTASTLQSLVKMQSEFHTAERLKEIESRLIRALEKVPTHYLTDFFEWYEGKDNG